MINVLFRNSLIPKRKINSKGADGSLFASPYSESVFHSNLQMHRKALLIQTRCYLQYLINSRLNYVMNLMYVSSERFSATRMFAEQRQRCLFFVCSFYPYMSLWRDLCVSLSCLRCRRYKSAARLFALQTLRMRTTERYVANWLCEWISICFAIPFSKKILWWCCCISASLFVCIFVYFFGSSNKWIGIRKAQWWWKLMGSFLTKRSASSFCPTNIHHVIWFADCYKAVAR